MSYKALYRMYRPQIFDQVVGQEHIVQTLKNAILNNKIGHAYLFSGPRGTGKTTIAQIFAREINKTSSGYNNDYSLDIIEMDAASNNGVGDIRAITDGAKYSPSEGKYKVYIVDEVHMLSKGAWNAFLKTLEEPPQHVVFILATTEPHKIPVTILSRTQRFNFKKIDKKIIEKRLKDIFKKEKIIADDESIKFIARLAQGGLRDALSIAEQVSSFANGQINFESISHVFGLVSIEKQIELLDSIFKGKTKDVILILTNLFENSASVEKLISSIIDIFRDYIIYRKTNSENFLEFLTLEQIKNIDWDINFSYKGLERLIKLSSSLRMSELAQHLLELELIKLSDYRNKANISLEENTILDQPKSNINLGQQKNVENIEETKISNNELEEINKTQTIEDEKPSYQNEPTKETKIVVHDELKSNDSQEAKENQGGVDVLKMFNVDKVAEISSIKKETQTIDNLINLFLHSEKDILRDMKERWKILAMYLTSAEYGKIARELNRTSIIAASKSFILLASEDEGVINSINDVAETEIFKKLIKNVFNSQKLVFAINKLQFTEAKDKWTKLKSEDNLPAKIPIVGFVDEVDEADQYGTQLFGDKWKG